ncbi:MAG: sigma-70 family RNA polymerase sigma factor [Dehalococcoidia bacterium]|nr:sigma-70 family RNA polymerase sigma factor [Dehalococcoidia bacterium]
MCRPSNRVGPAPAAQLDWRAPVSSNSAPGSPSSFDDESLFVDALNAGSDAAWTRLFNDNFHSLYVYAYYRVYDWNVAEEIASQVLEEALRGIKQFEYRGVPVRSWLFRIARNLTADHVQKTASRKETELVDVPGRDDFGDLHARAEIEWALAQLTDEQRMIVELLLVKGVSVENAAETADISEIKVRRVLARALDRLRFLLRGQRGAAA